MELTEKQKNHLLSLVGEGLKTREINKRGSAFKPPYKVSRQQVDYYRDSRGHVLEELTEASESKALLTGFAIKERRIEALNELALAIQKDLKEGCGIWMPQRKALGSGELMEVFDYEVFNEAAVRQFRGLLDDLAKEECGRTYQRRENPADADAEENTGELKITVEYESVQTTDET